MTTSTQDKGLKSDTFMHVLLYRSRSQAAKTAFQWLTDGENKGPSITYDELDTRARAIAAYLQSKGFANERLLLVYPPGLEFIAAFLGCVYSRNIAVPAYPPRSNHHMARLQAIVEDSGASLILTNSEKLASIEKLNKSSIDAIASDRISEEHAKAWSQPDVDQEQLMFLQYTSGSTGDPKGVMVSHGNLLHNLNMYCAALEADEGSRVLSWLPLFHDMGLIMMALFSIYSGSTCYLMAPLDFIQRPIRWLQAISDYGIHISAAPNFAYELCMQKVSRAERTALNLSTWRSAINGAEPVRSETLRRFTDVFADCGFDLSSFTPAYGLAEGTVLVSMKDVGSQPCIRSLDGKGLTDGQVIFAQKGECEHVREIVSCGPTCIGLRPLIVDPVTLQSCPQNTIGEIWIKGSSVAQGYWNKPDLSKSIFQAQPADQHDGPYLRTGDLGFVEGTEVFVTGRLKDLLVIRGQNHYPQDIELTAERSHVCLRQNYCAAFSVTDDNEEKLVIVVEVHRKYWPTNGEKSANVKWRTPVDLNEIESAVRQAVALGHDLSLHDLVLIRERSIPLTSSLKIQRRQCKQDYLQGTLAIWGDSDAISPSVA